MLNKNLTDSELYEEKFQFKTRRSNYRFYAALLALLTLFLGVRAWWTQTFGGIVVDGSSMMQTLSDGDNLLMSYVKDPSDLKRGDVIIVDVRDYPECGSTDFLIKRLIAVEGDRVKCVNGELFIWYAGKEGYESQPLVEDYAYYKDGKENYSFTEYEVGVGEIFFLGDNRQNSKDSRYQETGGSHLKNKLYKATDVYGIVPDWAIENKEILEVLLFHNFTEVKNTTKFKEQKYY